jgi:hypothetical protein
MFHNHRLLATLVFALTQTKLGVWGFASPKNAVTSTTSSSASSHRRLNQNTQLNMGVSKWNDEHPAQSSGDDDDDGLITKEMFLRNMLEEPEVRRKKKGGKEYKPHDNRDALPFVVKVKTPDPYTPKSEMMKQAKKNSEVAKKSTSSNVKTEAKKKKSVTIERSIAGKDAIAASIFSRDKDGELFKVLGQFQLDKNTNCGDLIEGEKEYLI